MDWPRVSVIITTYNYAHTLRVAIDSVLGQNYPNLEVLVLDNASEDTTPDCMDCYDDDPRVRYYRHSENIGVIRNHNAGLELATGEYIVFLSADDCLLDGALLAACKTLATNPQLDLVYTSMMLMNEHGTHIEPRGGDFPFAYADTRDELVAMLAYGNMVSFPTAVVRKAIYELFGPFHEHGFDIDDEILLRWAAARLRFGYSPYPGAAFRIHPQQLSSTQQYTASGAQLTNALARVHDYLTPNYRDRLQGHEYTIARNLRRIEALAHSAGFAGALEIDYAFSEIEEKLENLTKKHRHLGLNAEVAVLIDARVASWEDILVSVNSLQRQSYQHWHAIIFLPKSEQSLWQRTELEQGLGSQRCTIFEFVTDVPAAIAINCALRMIYRPLYTFLRPGHYFPKEHLQQILDLCNDEDAEVVLILDSLPDDESIPAYTLEQDAYIAGELYQALQHQTCCDPEAVAIRLEVFDRHQRFCEDIHDAFLWEFLLRVVPKVRCGFLQQHGPSGIQLSQTKKQHMISTVLGELQPQTEFHLLATS